MWAQCVYPRSVGSCACAALSRACAWLSWCPVGACWCPVGASRALEPACTLPCSLLLTPPHLPLSGVLPHDLGVLACLVAGGRRRPTWHVRLRAF